MKLTPQEKRIVEKAKNQIKYNFGFLAESQQGILMLLVKLSHSLEARAKRKGRVREYKVWAVVDEGGEISDDGRLDTAYDTKGDAEEAIDYYCTENERAVPAILTISLPRKVRGK